MFDEEPHSTAFRGVRFVLLGFNPLTETEHEVRSKLVDGGGADAGQYCQDCTHVIVDALVHDDPVCVAARRDGKTLVTSLWVYHSSDTGMLVDSSSIMYQPLKDLNGIPGAKSLVICLTGYQRQDRDDIMTMVGLMGAQFSKPLVANKVTHLICYKFEGEKYELAKKMKKINLVNHQWLEDCLRVWEIVPEANYNTSGYDLEIMEVEAKDSEEEAEDAGTENLAGRLNNGSPCHFKGKMSSAPELPLSVGRASPDAARGFSIVDHGQDVLLTTANNSTSDQASCLNAVDKKKLQLCSDHDTVAFGNDNSGKLSETPVSNRVRNGMASISTSADMCIQSGGNSSALSYLRKTPGKSNLPICLDGTSHSEACHSPKAHLGDDNAREENVVGAGSSISTLKGANLSCEDGFSDSLFQKKKTEIFCSGFKSPSKSPKACLDLQPGALRSPSVSSRKQGLEAASASHCEAYHSTSLLGVHSVREENAIGMASSINPPKGTNLSCEEGFSSLLPQKRKVDISCSSSKSPKMGHDFLPGVSGSPSMCNRKRVLETGSPLKAPFEADKQSSLIKNGHSTDTDIHSVPSSPANVLATNSVANDDDLQITCMPLSKTVSSGTAEDENAKTKASLKHYGRLKKPVYARKPHTEGSAMDITKTWSEPNCKGVEGSPNMKAAETENSLGHTDLDIQEKGNGNSKPKSSKRSMVASKKLSSRPKVSPSSTANQKGSLYLNKTSYQRDVANSKTSVEERADHAKSSKSCKSPMNDSVVNAESLREIRKEKDQDAKTDSMDEEAEAPEHKDEVDIVNDVNHEAEAMPKVDVMMQEKLEWVRGISNKTKADILGVHCDNMASNAVENEAEPETVVCSKEHVLIESVLKADTFKRQKIKAQRHPFGLTKEKACPKVEMAEKRVSQPTSMTKISNSPGSKMDSNMKMEKENKPVADGSQKRSQSKQCAAKVDGKDSRVTKTYQKAGKVDTDLEQGLVSKRSKTEPVCFILSGHRLQRKEFQQVIKSLKGRFCRDSHHWSYQATHFIAPEPIRRTEKFFAAAASGRWILKTDYLASSSREGKFLPEEPYEWHKNGLNEDGAINLEAPRKWRLLREKTGHGALYGMRIVIYGECIAPPLDTLKRAIKAGDGSILATSPPFTRFLKTGVDFAIVCPGMPRADMWVQEFLSHEIPCVSADYLVEYVCKPGYPLDKHVLYNTNAWAEKSLSNLVLLSEEILGNLTPVDDCGSGDLSCEVCGSCDRGEVMLICGNESGSVGCGIGTHIDCCYPPLEVVPVEDWLCPTCSESRP